MSIRERFEKKVQKLRVALGFDPLRGYLGDPATGALHVPGRAGYFYVRRDMGDGYLGIEELALEGVLKPDMDLEVVLRYNEDGLLVIAKPSLSAQVQRGRNPLVNNPADQQLWKWISVERFLPALVRPVGTADSPSTRVAILPWVTRRYGGEMLFDLTLELDLAAVIPAAGEQCLVVVGMGFGHTEAVSGVSAARDLNDQFTQADYQAALNRLPAGSVPLQFLRLADGQTAVTQEDFVLDAREIILSDSTNQFAGNPDVLRYPTVLPNEQHKVLYGPITVLNTCIVQGRLFIR